MRMRLITRILLGYLVIVGMIAVLGGVAYHVIGLQQAQARLITERELPAVTASRELLSAVRGMQSAEVGYFEQPRALGSWDARFQASMLDFDRWLAVARRFTAGPLETRYLDRIESLFRQFVEVDGEERAALARGDRARAITLDAGRALTLYNRITDLTTDYRKVIDQRIARTISGTEALDSVEERIFIATVAGALVLAILTALGLALPLNRAIGHLRDQLGALSEGAFPLLAPEGSFVSIVELASLRESFNRTSSQLELVTRHLGEANAALEARVEERTAELAAANRELGRAVEELKALDRAKSDFQANITHELLTPINFIVGFGSALLDGVAGDLSLEQGRCVEKMLSGAERLTGLVRNILDYTQLEAGTLPFHPQPVDYAAVVRDVVETHRPLAEAKTLSLTLELEQPLPLVSGDPSRLAQILFNLIDNAIKFTPQGGQVTIRSWAEDGRVQTEVRDTGLGIPAWEIPKIFSRFYQVDATSTRAHGGAGLGLSIVKKLLDLHGGSIRVESQPQQGSTFRFDLPVTS